MRKDDNVDMKMKMLRFSGPIDVAVHASSWQSRAKEDAAGRRASLIKSVRFDMYIYMRRDKCSDVAPLSKCDGETESRPGSYT